MDKVKRNLSLVIAFVLKHKIKFSIGFAFVVILFSVYYSLLAPPRNFPSGNIVIIAQGTSAPDVASELARAHIISHSGVLRFILRLSGESERIHVGAYRFASPENVCVVAYRLIVGDYGLPLVRLTFPEGVTVRDIAAQVADNFPSISAESFGEEAKAYEGYLFPDTYFFPSGTEASTILSALRNNFNSKTASLSGKVLSSGHSLSDSIIMASIIEKEANTDKDRHIISGILWSRLAIGMPLQVDVARETYTHKGLPREPICNPGLESIKAALEPTKTNYLYYLTGRDGLMHYSTTFAGHQANVRKYLN